MLSLRHARAADLIHVLQCSNTELALEWLEPQRAAMLDPSKADFFLQYQPGNPSGQPAGTIYNEDAGG